MEKTSILRLFNISRRDFACYFKYFTPCANDMGIYRVDRDAPLFRNLPVAFTLKTGHYKYFPAFRRQ